MKASQVKDTTPIKPLKEGNKVFLAKLPEYVEGDKGNSYKVEWVDKEGKVFSQTILDPFTPSTSIPDNLVNAGYNKMFRIFRAYMQPEAYNTFSEIDIPDLKTAIATFTKMVAPDWANVETTLIIGNKKYDGYLGLPTFTEFISTAYAPVTLEYPEQELSVEYVQNPTKPRAPRAGATPDQENKPKGNVNDDV